MSLIFEATIQETLEQTWEYMDKCGASSSHIIIFDRSPARSWEEKIFRWEERFKRQAIIVYGM